MTCYLDYADYGSGKLNKDFVKKYNEDLVRLNIQGTKFLTKQSELKFLQYHYHSDNKILSAICGKHKEMLTEYDSDRYYRFIYFDRDPVYFRAILRYLKTGNVILDQGMSPELLKEEAEFYGLTDPKFAELCNKWTLEMEIMEMKMEIQALQKEMEMENQALQKIIADLKRHN